MSLQLVVTYHDNAIMYYPVSAVGGWKIDAATRCLLVGRGVPRTFVPLDRVRSFDIEDTAAESQREELRQLDDFYCGAIQMGAGSPGYRCTEPAEHETPHRTTIDGDVVATWQRVSS